MMNTLQSIELWLVALILTIVVVGGFGIFARWCGESPAVRRDKLDMLRTGMTTAEVVAILGQPRETKQGNYGNPVWIYGSRLKRHALVLEFSRDDRMLAFTHGVPGESQPKSPFADR